jgi:hypothetical protein
MERYVACLRSGATNLPVGYSPPVSDNCSLKMRCNVESSLTQRSKLPGTEIA